VKEYFRDAATESSPIPAVCIPPGAHLILKAIPGFMQQTYGLEKEEGAVFVQINADENTYRDAVRFHNGTRIRLQDLRVGQIVEVLSLASALEFVPPQHEYQLQ
jgi:hypothetical protein